MLVINLKTLKILPKAWVQVKARKKKMLTLTSHAVTKKIILLTPIILTTRRIKTTPRFAAIPLLITLTTQRLSHSMCKSDQRRDIFLCSGFQVVPLMQHFENLK